MEQINNKAVERKVRSEKILFEKEIPINQFLPVIENEEDVVIRTKEEIGKRAVALSVVAMRAEFRLSGASAEEEENMLDFFYNIYNAKEFLTNDEKRFLSNNNPSQHESMQYIWRFEALWVLMWALGYIEKLEFPNKICEVKYIATIMTLTQDFDNLVNARKLKTKEEILDEADLIFRYNWACVDARANRKRPPSDINSDVVMERHKTLNWLINYVDDEWDNVRTDT